MTHLFSHDTIKVGREPLFKERSGIISNITYTVDGLRPIDDTFFRKLAERKEFCEEFLRVILKETDLNLIENIPQRSFHNLEGRSVTVDVLCKDSSQRYYSIEIQKTNNDDHQKRVRYNSSNVDIYISEKGTKFRELPDVYMIYISDFDSFKKGKTVYHVIRVLEETGTEVNNGVHEIYVNTKVDDGSDTAGLMKIFQSSSVPDDRRFQNICSTIRYYKAGRGRGEMCKIVDDYAKEYAEEYAKEYAIEYAAAQKNEWNKSLALEMIRSNYTNDEIQRLLKFPLEDIVHLRNTAECLS